MLCMKWIEANPIHAYTVMCECACACGLCKLSRRIRFISILFIIPLTIRNCRYGRWLIRTHWQTTNTQFIYVDACLWLTNYLHTRSYIFFVCKFWIWFLFLFDDNNNKITIHTWMQKEQYKQSLKWYLIFEQAMCLIWRTLFCRIWD